MPRRTRPAARHRHAHASCRAQRARAIARRYRAAKRRLGHDPWLHGAHPETLGPADGPAAWPFCLPRGAFARNPFEACGCLDCRSDARVERVRARVGWRAEARAEASAWHPGRMDDPAGDERRAEADGAWIGPRPRLDGRIVLAPPDPAWPAVFAVVRARIRAALGPDAAVEHVGSTSVPGLPAKPIIDVLLLVPAPADEEAYVPPLAAAGFRLVVREPDWHEHRLLKGTGPDANLHVLATGCPEAARMLAFRDRLRASDAERDRYAAAKAALAERDWAYVQDYADAKSAIVEAILAELP